MVCIGIPLFLSCETAPEVFYLQRPPPEKIRSSTGPYITLMLVAPVQTDVGATVNLIGDAAGSADGKAIRFQWTGRGGTIAHPEAHETTYVCVEKGPHPVTLTVTDILERHDSLTTTVQCE